MPAGTLSAVRDTGAREGKITRYLMAASKTIYKGGFVSLVSGLAQPSAEASGEIFAGVAVDSVVSAASGSYYVDVETYGVHRCTWYDDNAVAQADVGCEVYVCSDEDVSPNASTSGATNESVRNVKCGRLVGFDGAVALVHIDNYAA